MRKKQKPATSIRFVDDDLLKKLNKIAEVSKRNRTKEIEFILSQFVEDYERNYGKIDISEESNS